MEDVGDSDHTSLSSIPLEAASKARLIIKGEGILAGVSLAEMIIKRVDPKLKTEIFIQDGSFVKSGDIGFHLYGNVHSILKAERLVLNCMQRMSGIATLTGKLTNLIAHTKAKVVA